MHLRLRAPRRLAPLALAGVLAAGVTGLSTPAAHAQGKPSVSLAVPAYFSDDASWEKVINTSIVSYVIGHPDSPAIGSKFAADQDLTRHFDAAKAKGKTTLMYVAAGFDKIGWETVADRIDSAFDAYPNVDGVFIDEINYDQCDKYASLSKGSGSIKGVRARHPGKLVILNPGAPILNCYQGLADGYLNLERADKDVPAWTDNVNLPGNTPFYAWMFKPETRATIWQMVHTVASSKAEQAVDDAVSRNASVLFITPDSLPNPYDKLPDDATWTKIIERVNQYANGKLALPVVKQLVVPAAATTTAAASASATTTTKKPLTVSKATPRKPAKKKIRKK